MGVLIATSPLVAANTDNSVAHTIIARDVIVAPGDTLTSIAKRELGRAGLAPQLAEFNSLVVSAPLVPGQIVHIPIHVPVREEFADVIFVKGNVIARRALPDSEPPEAITVGLQTSDFGNGETIVLSRDTDILPGDLIDTGDNGFVSIEFSSGSVINLQPSTVAILNRLNCLPSDDSCIIDIQTVRGKVTSNVQPREDQPVDFRITTPYATAAVRGTFFDIDADQQDLIVGVTEGIVDLSSQGSDKLVQLEQGFGSFIKDGGAPNDPIALLNAPVFKRVPTRVARGDSISWWPIADAIQYATLISSDAAGSDALTTFNVNSDNLGVEGIQSGDYFIHLRGVDENGIQGFRSQSMITIADIDSNLSPVNTTISVEGSEYLVEVTNPSEVAIGYEIQIANDASFDDPLSVDVDAGGSAYFRVSDNVVYARARILMDPYTVSEFGNVANGSR